MAGMTARAGGLALPEGSTDQRGVGFDIRTHTENVAGLQTVSSLERVEERVGQHLHLAGRAMTGVHLHRPVVAGRAGNGLRVVPDRPLYDPQKTPLIGLAGPLVVMVDVVTDALRHPRLQALLQLTRVAGE